jgi:hypothetical protein
MEIPSGRLLFVTSALATGVLNLAIGPASAQSNPERNAYFGETHIHTSWSVDAWVMGNRITESSRPGTRRTAVSSRCRRASAFAICISRRIAAALARVTMLRPH